MATQNSQSFNSHTQWTPGYHYFASPLSIIYLIWSIQRLIKTPDADTAFALVGALALFGAIAMVRLSPLRVQDRLIRHEERTRLMRLLPEEMQARIETLHPRQLVALRFAPDAEVVELVRQVYANPEMSSNEIKAQIKRWKADYFRA